MMGATKRYQIIEMASFWAADQLFAVDIMRVREILRMMPITPIQGCKATIEGVVLLRGSMYPVVDFRKLLRGESRLHAQQRIIMVVVGDIVMGLIVDKVNEVVRVPLHTLKQAPVSLTPTHVPYFLGVCEYMAQALTLIDFHHLAKIAGLNERKDWLDGGS